MNYVDVDGTTGIPRVQSVPDGSTLTFEMRSWPNDPSKESLDDGHKGPCAVYLKKVDSAIDDRGMYPPTSLLLSHLTCYRRW
jgi:hypothetical protein